MEVEAQKHAGLRVAPVEVSQLTEYLQVTGAVQPVDSQVAHVRPLARGRLDEVFARVGDRVRKGQALARYDNIEAGELVSQYASAEAELTRLRVQAAALARQTERNKSLSDIGAAPKKDYELSVAEQHGAEQHARAQESVLAGVATRLKRFGVNPSDDQGSPRTALQTPFDGVVIKVNAAPGRVIEPADELFTVADLSRVWVQAEVYEKDLGRIRAGRSASITVDTYPGEQFSGKIAYIADFLDPQTRTARVRCEVPNPGIRLKLDMFASVQLPTTFSRRALVVPLAALQQLDGKTVVFVRTGPTWFEVRAVKSGNTVLNQTEIVDGLKPGEPVVVQGAFHLKSIVAGKQLGEE
ncbi:MAG: efflux RND transporter periplasmic adaptor subunit [Acidobacteria bacterium]|nr:efflux RND transporter periplasmic adaptor subunit [Acidobacteriota bacterium]MBI3470492.1 efflux RND transporter periplasmic adaptor subunit [Candidatus Solibacter usitatus]